MFQWFNHQATARINKVNKKTPTGKERPYSHTPLHDLPTPRTAHATQLLTSISKFDSMTSHAHKDSYNGRITEFLNWHTMPKKNINAHSMWNRNGRNSLYQWGMEINPKLSQIPPSIRCYKIRGFSPLFDGKSIEHPSTHCQRKFRNPWILE